MLREFAATLSRFAGVGATPPAAGALALLLIAAALAGCGIKGPLTLPPPAAAKAAAPAAPTSAAAAKPAAPAATTPATDPAAPAKP